MNKQQYVGITAKCIAMVWACVV